MSLFQPLWQPATTTAATIPFTPSGGLTEPTVEGALIELDTKKLAIAAIDDTPVNGVVNAPISSNWAYDHAATALAHSITGAAEIATDLADDDEVPVYDLSTTTNKKSLLSRFWTYISGKLSSYTGALTGSSLTVSGSDEPTYGAELLTTNGWTVNAGWTEAPDDTFTHTGSGGTATLVHSATIANATKYQLTYTITGRTAGTVTITFGGQTSGAVSASGAIGPTTSSTAAFTVTPTTEFDGVCVFSLKAITGVSTARLVVKDAGGASIIEARGKATSNTFLGLNAGAYCTTGYYNSFVGANAGFSNTTGYYNSFLGMYAGYSNTTGYNNSFVGASAGYSNTTGYNNSFVGVDAGYYNTTGDSNSFVGMNAGRANTTGYYNCFVGMNAGRANTTGYYNSFVGANAGFSNTTGYYNSFLGMNAGYANTTGNYNSFVGMNAGCANTTGYSNSFLGAYAGYSNTTGTSNSFLSTNAGSANTTGSSNSFVGHGAGRFHADGATALTDPEGCVYIGYEARGKDNADNNSVVIGGNTPIGLGANTTVIGTSATTLTRLYGDVATGVDAPSAAVHAIKTTEQLRLGYDASNYLAATVSSTGNLTLDTTGGTIYTPDTIENTVNGGGIILKSPDGTRYRITVANGGALSVSAA